MTWFLAPPVVAGARRACREGTGAKSWLLRGLRDRGALVDGHRLHEQLGDVHRLDVVLALRRFDPVGDHRHAERARARERLGAGVDELERAALADALLALALLHEELRAAGTAAETLVLVPVGNLEQAHARDRLEHLARRVVHVVVPAEVTAVVI